MIRLDIEAWQLQAVIAEVDATDDQVRRAIRSTVGRMSTWLRTRAARAIRSETKLGADVVRRRLKNIKLKTSSDGAAGGVWVGLDPVDLKFLAPEHDATGVTAGPSGRRELHKGAFMGPRPGTAARKLQGRAFKRSGAKRLPIDKQEHDIKDQADKALENNVFDGFEAQFFAVLERELKWRTRTPK